MCGIAGIVSSQRDITPEQIRRMISSIAHRGPDAEGVRILRTETVTAGLGHRRLSIIDLATGAQPMANEDESIWISYNGELYNHLELRRELEGTHLYRTRSDTETIVHAYEQWGPDCVQRFRGMFAFVIWDGRRRQLFAARDQLGIKPFYYTSSDDTLVFASEIKALLSSGHSAALNVEALPEYVTFGYLSGEHTLFRNVHKLLPGHWLVWRPGSLTIQKYWDVPPVRREDGRNESDYVEEFRSLFSESVRRQLMSDVPLGVFLSGGLDSSAIAATMAREVKGPIQTFSVGFANDGYNEFRYSREVAVSLGAKHHEICLEPEDYARSLCKLIWHEDEPIRFLASVPLYFVSKLAREHVKVVLTGEGSDELFAGYDKYWATLFNLRWGGVYETAVPGLLRRAARKTMWKWPLPLSFKKKVAHTFVAHGMDPHSIVLDNFWSVFPSRLHETLFTPEVYDSVKQIDPYARNIELLSSRDPAQRLDQLLYLDQKTYLLELLMKQDNMSMATSIESRVPFLDHKFVEFASRVPDQYKVQGRRGKYLVKRAMQGLVPDSVIKREKMGFPVPFAQWLRSEFRDRVSNVLVHDRTRTRGIFRQDTIEQMWSDHQSGRRDFSDPLWIMLNFELWARIFLDGESCEDVAADWLTCHDEVQPLSDSKVLV
jgi:asparagine synthase (glutamine-hydrolysing)